MQNAIIYGCGSKGRQTYHSIKKVYNILYFSDKNEKLHGTEIFGLKVVPPESLKELLRSGETALIIASMFYREIIEDLNNKGVDLSYGKVILAYNNFLTPYLSLSELEHGEWKSSKYKRVGVVKPIEKVLLVQNTECNRSSKLMDCLKKRGIQVDFAHLTRESYVCDNLSDKYGKCYTITDLGSFAEFVNNSDYDIIHSSNFPDYLTTFLNFCNKPVVHDNHDLGSINYPLKDSDVICEYTALKYCAGNLFCSEISEAYITKRFNLYGKPTCFITNSVITPSEPVKRLPKLSSLDGEIHCVYSGTIAYDSDKKDKRYMEDIFLKIAEAKIHVHFYSAASLVDENIANYFRSIAEKSPYVHYEGSVAADKMLELLTQYDVGLLMFNVNPMACVPFAISTQNRAFEYPYSGIPMAVSELFSFKNFVEKYNLGKALVLNDSIYSQMEEIKNIKIPDSVLEDNGLTIETQMDKLITFYQDSIDYFNQTKRPDFNL